MILRCKPLLGTFVEIRITQENSSGYCAIDEAFVAIERVQSLMSFFDEESEVSQLNRHAHNKAIGVSPTLFEVLNFSQKISQISNGAFDITLHRSTTGCSFSDVELQENCHVKFRQKLLIDLGGIAKGYAVDCAGRVLENHGISNYIINAGGDIRVGKSPQKILIRNPQNPSSAICEAEISEGALATSAGYFSQQEVNGQKIYPIFDPRRGPLKYEEESVSVFAKDCMTADALTKVVLILKEESGDIIKQFGAEARIF